MERDIKGLVLFFQNEKLLREDVREKIKRPPGVWGGFFLDELPGRLPGKLPGRLARLIFFMG
jgi:hypothetical protein